MYPSVTQVLSLYSDFSMVNPNVLENAAQRGTDVHRICSNIALGLWVANIPDDCAGFVLSFQSWFLSTVETVLLSEPEMIDQDNGYIGHPDMVCRIKEDPALTIVDLKTPAATHPSWRLQLAAYRNLSEKSEHQVGRALSLRLKADGSRPIVDEYTGSYAHDLSIFLNALTVWRFYHD